MEKTQNSDFWREYGTNVFITFERNMNKMFPGVVKIIFFIVCNMSILGIVFPVFSSRLPLDIAYIVTGFFFVVAMMCVLCGITALKIYVSAMRYRAACIRNPVPPDENETIWNIMLILKGLENIYRCGNTLFIGFFFYNMMLASNFLSLWMGNPEFSSIFLIFELMYIPIWILFKMTVLNPSLHFGLHALPITRKVKEELDMYVIGVIIGGGMLTKRSSLDIPIVGIYFDESKACIMRSISSPFHCDETRTSKVMYEMATNMTKYFNSHSDTGFKYVISSVGWVTMYNKDIFENFFEQDTPSLVLNYLVSRRIASGVYHKLSNTLSKRYFPVEVNDKILSATIENMDGVAYPSNNVPRSIIDMIGNDIDMYSHKPGSEMSETIIVKKNSKYHDSIEETILKDGFIKV